MWQSIIHSPLHAGIKKNHYIWKSSYNSAVKNLKLKKYIKTALLVSMCYILDPVQKLEEKHTISIPVKPSTSYFPPLLPFVTKAFKYQSSSNFTLHWFVFMCVVIHVKMWLFKETRIHVSLFCCFFTNKLSVFYLHWSSKCFIPGPFSYLCVY